MSDLRTYRTKKVPPECSGWSFCVLLGLATTTGLCFSSFIVFPLMFADFIESVGGGTSSFTFVMGISSIATSLCALFTGSIVKILSMRGTALLGSMLYFVGNFCCIFVTSVEQLTIAYGILMGVGIGLILPAAYAVFNDYFVKTRVMMMSVAQSIIGVINMLYPVLVQFLINTYGFRGALAINAAINANVVLAMLVMHPVEWHYKIVPLLDAETQPLTNEASILENGSQNNKKSSEMEISNPSNEVLQDETNDSTKNGKWQKVVDFLDLRLLKDIVFVNIIFGLNFVTCGDGLFFSLQPLYLFELNISKDDTALIMSLIGGFDLGSRIFLSIISMFITVKARNSFAFGTVASIVLRFVFLNVFDFPALVVVSALMGFIRSFITVPTSLVIAEHLPTEKFASGYGLFTSLQGFMYFLLSPLVGWIRDVTESYVICFHTLTLILGICCLTWIIEFVWIQMLQRKSTKSVDDSNETN